MATLEHNNEYPCAFDLILSEWERYPSQASEKAAATTKVLPLGEPHTLWVVYRMALRIGNSILYESKKETTLILEDIRELIDDLRQLAGGKKNKIAFDPIEPDFGLLIRNLTESDATVMVSSAAKLRGEMPTGATNQCAAPSELFDVNVWIDYPNQADRFYGGYGPGLYFYVETSGIERFASQLQAELDALGPYFTVDGK